MVVFFVFDLLVSVIFIRFLMFSGCVLFVCLLVFGVLVGVAVVFECFNDCCCLVWVGWFVVVVSMLLFVCCYIY